MRYLKEPIGARKTDRAVAQRVRAAHRRTCRCAGGRRGARSHRAVHRIPEPLFAAQEQRMQRWRRSRRQLVLREDLRDLSRIRDIGLVDQLVALLPERIGSPLSVNVLREDLQVAFDTVKGWLATLERLYFLFELRPFSGRLARTLRREGKIYLFDHTEIEDPGARFENLVALQPAQAGRLLERPGARRLRALVRPRQGEA